MQRKYNILPYDVTIEALKDWAIQVTREREIDLDDYNNQIAGNPFIYEAPASSTTLVGTEKVGDIATDTNTLHVVVDDSGLEYRRISYACYGDMYQYNASTTITVSASGTFYDVTGMSSNNAEGITFQNTHELLILRAGTYKVDWSCTLTDGSGTPILSGAVGINGTAQTNTVGQEKVSSGDRACASGTGFITCAVNDVVTLMVANETNTNNITVYNCNLTLQRVDD